MDETRAKACAGARAGSGFISRNNDDPTAEATCAFMQAARIPREWTISWNVIPWWDGHRKATASELRDGVDSVKDLISLLPRLRVVVLVGKKAGRARRLLEGLNLTILQSDHPSPIVKARWRARWDAIPNRWAEVRAALSGTSAR